jgi:hypothetical protein
VGSCSGVSPILLSLISNITSISCPPPPHSLICDNVRLLGMFKTDNSRFRGFLGVFTTGEIFLVFKGRVSRDLHMFLVPLIDLRFLHRMEPFVYFLNFVFASNFSLFASQRSELTLSLSGVQKQDFFYWFYTGK